MKYDVTIELVVEANERPDPEDFEVTLRSSAVADLSASIEDIDFEIYEGVETP